MGRKKIEFTTEQDVRIKQLVNEGYSLNGILSKINDEFSTTFSRSCIDRRIKTLGIERPTQNTVLKVTGGITTLNPKLASRVEELCEWKRRQADDPDAITEQDIANEMSICVKTLNKMYKQFDIPKRLCTHSRPDIYFNVKQLVDCTTFRKEAREWIYEEIIKRKTKDMRVERDVIIRTEPMTIKFRYYNNDGKYVEKSVDMDGVDLRVDFYFPDYKTGFFYDDLGFKSLCDKNSAGPMIPLHWSSYLRTFKNDVKLMPVVPIESLEDRYIDIEFMARSMIERAISGEYRCWKDV